MSGWFSRCECFGNRPQPNREGFTESRGSMEQSRLAIEIVLPGLPLKRKGRPAPCLEPFNNLWVQFGQIVWNWCEGIAYFRKGQRALDRRAFFGSFRHPGGTQGGLAELGLRRSIRNRVMRKYPWVRIPHPPPYSIRVSAPFRPWLEGIFTGSGFLPHPWIYQGFLGFGIPFATRFCYPLSL